MKIAIVENIFEVKTLYDCRKGIFKSFSIMSILIREIALWRA
jgi:hypothetical protein